MSGEIQPGTELFGYVVQRVVGTGGMGAVYLAKQMSLGRMVALKVLHPARIRNRQQVESFLREAQAAGRFNHPHLVLVHDAHADADRGLYCYAMEYVPGRTLSKLVTDRGPLAPSAALHLVYQVAKALAHAHKAGLVHRDVKPDNVLVADNGLAKLADLGLVRDRLEGIASSGSRVLSIVGTPEYSAPEQARNPKRATPASDVYSLGACLHFALIGRPPFVGETVIDTIVRAAMDPLVLPESLDRSARAILERTLAKDPRQRPQDGDALVAALEAVARGAPIPDPEPESDEIDDDTLGDEEPVEGEVETDTSRSGRMRSRRRRRRR